MTIPSTPDDDHSSLVFVPWVRTGVAAAIDVTDTLGAQLGVADITANLTVNGDTNLPPLTVRLRGPADIIGIDAHQIIRLDPPPGSTDFESSNFACVEFDRPDYPWLFTPAAANPDGKLRPWLCLVVVRKQDGVTIGSSPDAPLPLLTVATPAKPSLELPNLTDSWAWAHAQAAPDSPPGPVPAGDVRDALNNDPARSLSRLICPRVLTPNTDFIACVVPTFSLSAKTGQGTAVVDAELGKTSLTPAWTVSAASVTVPVYYHWEFRTGPEGDFATLAAKLRARPAPDRLGRRTIDISDPGFTPSVGFPAGATIDMEGALRPIVPDGAPDIMPPWPVGAQNPFQVTLANLLNAPAVIAAAAPDADPVVGPALYGRWHVNSLIASPTGGRWYDEINLDPRLRAVAALGTKVVQENQEALMVSAWEQAGEVRAANQRLRQLQMSMAVGTRLMTRHFNRMTQEHATRVGAPLFGQIAPMSATGIQPFATVAGQLPSASIPAKAVSPAMRRIGRLRGPITRRIVRQNSQLSRATPWVDALSTGAAALPAVPPSDLVTISGLIARSGVGIQPFTSLTSAAVAGRTSLPFFLTHPDGQPMVTALSESVAMLPYDSFQAKIFRQAAAAHLARVKPERGAIPTILPHVPPSTITDVQGALTAGTEPTKTVTAVAHTVIVRNRQGNVILPALTTDGTADDATDGLGPVMAAPAFPHAMSEPLRDLSQDLILPGLDAVPADTVLGLETNRRFIEAFMLGLNVEMGRELLWRGYPTDERGTYFASFWSDGRPDVKPLSAWGTNALAGDALAPNSDERFVMLLRSSLLKRYPDALIYLTRAVPAATGRAPSELVADERQPIFSGAMDPDVAFFGFDFSTVEAMGDGTPSSLGYYVVIQEHPTAPRFGLQNGATIPAGTTHVAIGKNAPAGQQTFDLAWGLNSATTAAIVRHRPTRLAIHASLFLAPQPAPPTQVSLPPAPAASPPPASPPAPPPPVESPPPPPQPESGPVVSPPADGLPGSFTSSFTSSINAPPADRTTS
jgi:hypothetical protein